MKELRQECLRCCPRQNARRRAASPCELLPAFCAVLPLPCVASAFPRAAEGHRVHSPGDCRHGEESLTAMSPRQELSPASSAALGRLWPVHVAGDWPGFICRNHENQEGNYSRVSASCMAEGLRVIKGLTCSAAVCCCLRGCCFFCLG